MLTKPIPNQSLGQNSTSLQLDLTPYFDVDAITGSVVRILSNTSGKTNTFYLELFDQLHPTSPAATRTTPLTATNFLGYVDRGAYNNVIFHRLVKGFVLQGGGFAQPLTVGNTPPSAIPQGDTVTNEPGNNNVRGTVAMAKLGGDPNSATNQWFINLADNRANLDNQNGGFTAFARVLGKGMTLVDKLAASTVVDADGGGVFSQLPLQNLSKTQKSLRPTNYLAVSKAERSDEVTYRVKVIGAKATVSADGQLQLSWTKVPTKPVKVSIEASSILDGDIGRTSFQVLPFGQEIPSAVMQGGNGGVGGLF